MDQHHRDEPSEPPANGEDAADDENLRILIVEDNETNREVVEMMLGALAAETTAVENGREAVEAWAANTYDLILMDIQMPIMSGVEATIEIRKRERENALQPIPIVAVTANVMKEQVEEYYAVGMQDCVAKPVQARVLLQAVLRAVATPMAA